MNTRSILFTIVIVSLATLVFLSMATAQSNSSTNKTYATKGVVELGGSVLQAECAKFVPVRSKRVGLDDIRTRLKVLAMNFQYNLWLTLYEVLVAAFERLAAKVFGRQVSLLNHGSHGSIKNQNPIP